MSNTVLRWWLPVGGMLWRTTYIRTPWHVFISTNIHYAKRNIHFSNVLLQKYVDSIFVNKDRHIQILTVGMYFFHKLSVSHICQYHLLHGAYKDMRLIHIWGGFISKIWWNSYKRSCCCLCASCMEHVESKDSERFNKFTLLIRNLHIIHHIFYASLNSGWEWDTYSESVN